MFNNFLKSIQIPFSYEWDIKLGLSSPKSVLDVGCGAGFFGKAFNKDKRFALTGLDLFEPYLKQAKASGFYSDIKKADLTKKLPFKNSTFESVVCLQTVEHLKKDIGYKLIREIERVASETVIITVPVGECIQTSVDNNKLQEHLSTWNPNDFRELGYQIRGVGLKIVYGKYSYSNKKVAWWMWPLLGISFFANPFTYFVPDIAAQMIAIKKISK